MQVALSPREHQVVVLASLGHANKVIAGELGLSVSTVSVYLLKAGRKLGVRGRVYDAAHESLLAVRATLDAVARALLANETLRRKALRTILREFPTDALRLVQWTHGVDDENAELVVRRPPAWLAVRPGHEKVTVATPVRRPSIR
jgi:DNA-binding CsgD family transcriptional regulator